MDFKSRKPALAASIRTLAHAAVDVVAVLKPGQSIIGKIAIFENLIPDVIANSSVIGSLSSELSSMQPADFTDAASLLISELHLSSPKAVALSEKIIKLLSDAGNGIIPDLIDVLAAAKA